MLDYARFHLKKARKSQVRVYLMRSKKSKEAGRDAEAVLRPAGDLSSNFFITISIGSPMLPQFEKLPESVKTIAGIGLTKTGMKSEEAGGRRLEGGRGCKEFTLLHQSSYINVHHHRL